MDLVTLIVGIFSNIKALILQMIRWQLKNFKEEKSAVRDFFPGWSGNYPKSEMSTTLLTLLTVQLTTENDRLSKVLAW